MPEYVRVRCEDTGHASSLQPSAAVHGNYTVLDEPAVDPVTGDVLPTVYATKPRKAARESLSSQPTSGQKAEPKKEHDNG